MHSRARCHEKFPLRNTQTPWSPHPQVKSADFSSSRLISTSLQSYLATWQSPALLAYISLTALPCILFSHLNTMSRALSACDVGTPPYVAITILKIFPLTAPHRPANQPRQPQCLPRLSTRIDGNALRSFCSTLVSANRLCPAVVWRRALCIQPPARFSTTV